MDRQKLLRLVDETAEALAKEAQHKLLAEAASPEGTEAGMRILAGEVRGMARFGQALLARIRKEEEDD